ncbi:hypothetical protein PHMEG_00018512 [Phytophthora megakarya]|uniref:RxLR effector PexRD54 WY domain-containing protein n=1 Tax=Phytophthora megakarya TaxID=4795 RepID=A0A225VUQ2_9STRA|nr:hypothetical protein PHMEG_00018512 [Phytophthora megakarya]
MEPTSCPGLITLFVLIQIDASAATSKLLKPDSNSSFTVKADISTTRLLRTSSAVDNKDETRTGISISVLERIKTLALPSKITPEKLQGTLHGWLNKRKSADIVFKRLRLDQEDGVQVFFNPLFARWVQYTDDLNAKTPGISAISTLTKHYGEEKLVKLIDTAMGIRHMKDIASKLEEQQIQRWVAARKDPDKVFRLYSLHELEAETMFRSTNFAVWVKYMDEVNAKYPEAPMLMIPTLAKYFPDHVILTKMAAAPKNEKGIRRIAIQLEDERLRTWLHSRKTPDMTLFDLGFTQATDTLVDNPLFKIWLKYMNTYNARYPDKTKMMKEFTQTYGDADATKILHVMESKDTTRSIATELANAQLNMWLNGRKSTDAVFTLLKLDTDAQHFRDKYLLNTWVSYLNSFILKNPDTEAALFTSLGTRLDDRPMNKILNLANEFPSMKSFATAIQNEKIQGYHVQKKSPDDVFDLLAIDFVGDKVLGTPLFQSWLNYWKVYNVQNSNTHYWFTKLRMEYGSNGIDRMIDQAMQNPSTVEMGNMVQKAWVKQWLDWGKSPSATFQFLGLNSGVQPLSSPKFNIWAKYLDDFNGRYHEHKITMIDALMDHFSEYKLLPMFNAAKSDPNTEKLAANLQNALINKWFDKKINPDDLLQRLHNVEGANELIQRYRTKLKDVSVPGNAA